ncbi:hypothetical protein ACFOU2_20225 [Bacillus songklensis]|uniref:Uncharacterized protein n=1 Tax=Bacillus songklensis TaxID=1069116 RepID=A0ABV8B933_9BACI
MKEISHEWNIPGGGKVIAQMPFGKPAAPAGDKEFRPLKERVNFFKK